MKLETFVRRPFTVEGVQVTKENMEEISKWCGGEIRSSRAGDPYIKVKVINPQSDRHTRAFVNDWVLYGGKTLDTDAHFKVYTPKAFDRTFVINKDTPDYTVTKAS